MPIYSYRCTSCNHITDLFKRKMPVTVNEKCKCEICNQLAEKIVSNTTFKLIGYGFFKNDSKVDPNRNPKIPKVTDNIKKQLGIPIW